MRLALLAIGVFIAGTGVAGMKLDFVPKSDQMALAMRALGGDPSQPNVVAVNPIRTIYDNVIRQITTPESSSDRLARLGFHASPVSPPDFSAMENAMSRRVPIVPNGFGANIAEQTQQFNDRMQDLRTYARNPAGWHGPPPQ